jgi:hypothetical protein
MQNERGPIIEEERQTPESSDDSQGGVPLMEHNRLAYIPDNEREELRTECREAKQQSRMERGRSGSLRRHVSKSHEVEVREKAVERLVKQRDEGDDNAEDRLRKLAEHGVRSNGAAHRMEYQRLLKKARRGELSPAQHRLLRDHNAFQQSQQKSREHTHQLEERREQKERELTLVTDDILRWLASQTLVWREKNRWLAMYLQDATPAAREITDRRKRVVLHYFEYDINGFIERLHLWIEHRWTDVTENALTEDEVEDWCAKFIGRSFERKIAESLEDPIKDVMRLFERNAE